MINNLVMQCNAVKDPAKIENPNFALTRLRVACNADKTDRETLFIDCFFYGKSAENCLKMVTKGAPLIIAGRLTQRTYENKEGKKVTEIQVAVDRWQLLNRKGEEVTERDQLERHASYKAPEIKEDDLPF